MLFTSLDTIVRNKLLNSGFPVHFYLQYLNYAKDCLRELHFDCMKSVNTKKLLVNSYKAVKIPCDYVDLVEIGFTVGQKVMPMAKNDAINNLNNYDSAGQRVVYGDTCSALKKDTYKILRERKEIQLDEAYPYDYVILQYITDGMDSDAATEVHPYAQATIEAYINWQYKCSNRSFGAGERQMEEGRYIRARANLVARMNDMTLADIKESMRKAHKDDIHVNRFTTWQY